MEQIDQVESVDAGKVPLRFADLLDLFSRPRQFFAGSLDLGATRYMFPAVWIVGISAQIDRLDTEILRHDFDATRRSWEIIGPIVTGSWWAFWAWCLGVGLISGGLVYLVGGWWYRMRLYMSGSGRSVDPYEVRQVYIFSSLVVAVPGVLMVLAFTAIYPSYIAAYNADEYVSTFLILFVFWSVAVSYIGVTTTFEVTKWKARTWFLILPIVFYVLVLGVLVALVAFFAGEL